MSKAPVLPTDEVSQALAAIGESLKRARLARGDTQAVAAGRLGVHEQTISRIEAGRVEVAVGHVFAMLDMYGKGKKLFALAEDDEQTLILLRRLLPTQGTSSKGRSRK